MADFLRSRWARSRRRGRLGLGEHVALLESVTIDPRQVVLGPVGEVLVVAQARGEVGDGLDPIGIGGSDQGHVAIADIGAVLGLVGEGAGEIANRDDQGLLDQVGVERDTGDLVELDEARPLDGASLGDRLALHSAAACRSEAFSSSSLLRCRSTRHCARSSAVSGALLCTRTDTPDSAVRRFVDESGRKSDSAGSGSHTAADQLCFAQPIATRRSIAPPEPGPHPGGTNLRRTGNAPGF